MGVAMMNYETFLRRIPKVELHMHFGGSVREDTLLQLANDNGIPLPEGRSARPYEYADFDDFLRTFDLVSSCVRKGDDFARVVYESLEDGVCKGNLRYREMFFNPSVHLRAGVDHRTMMNGMLEGIAAAERDFNVRCRLIAAIHRGHPPELGQQVMELMVSEYRDDIIGMGSDSGEGPGEIVAPYAGIYRYAKKQGLRTCVHAAESPNTSHNFALALDVLECDRIDHGYDILNDPALVQRAMDTQMYFTCCPTAAATVLEWPDRSRQPIRTMIEKGLNVTINTDDPTMFKTDVGQEFADACIAMGIGIERAVHLCLAAIDGSWLDDGEKRAMRVEFTDEIDALRSSLVAGEAEL